MTWTPECYAIHGLAPGGFEGTGAAFFRLVHPDDREFVGATVRAAIRDRVLYTSEFRIVRPDGEVVWVKNRGRAYSDEAGEPRRMLGTITDISETKQAIAALARSEERFAEAQRAARVGTWDWDLATDEATWTEQAWRLFGFAPFSRRIDYALWRGRLHPEDRDRATERVQAALRTGRYHDVYRIRLDDGTSRWLESEGLAKLDAAGLPTRMLGTVRDVTERHEAEAALRASELRLQAMAESMPQLVWRARPGGHVDYYNARVGGYGGVEQLPDGSWTWSTLVHPEDLERTLRAWQAAEAEGHAYACEHRLRMADGSYRWHLSRANPVRDGQGVLMWYGTATDIHEHREVADRLERASAVLRAINEATPVLVAMKDRDSRIVLANPAVIAMTGRPEAEVIGHDDTRWFGPELGARIIEHDRRVMASLQTETFEEVTPGGRVWLTTKTPWRGPSGELLGVIAVAHEITERQRAEVARRENEARLAESLTLAERAVRAREVLVSVVSHDLRSPLSALASAVEILRRRPEALNAPGREPLAERMHRQVTRMTRLIEELLDVAHLQGGTAPVLARETTDLVELARAVADLQRSVAPDRSIVLRAPPALAGRWDARRLERVLDNLLINAIKFSPGGGEVAVEVERTLDGKAAVLRVRDRGIGIPEAEQGRIFEWFRRGRNALDLGIQGTGMGLAYVREVVSLHGGSIAVESRPGDGSTFTVTLPLASE